MLTHVTASAPAARPRPRPPRRSGRCWRSASPSGAGHTPAVASMTSADRAGSWAKIDRRPSRFGHDRLTSTATTWSGAAASSSAACAVVVDRASPDARHHGRPARHEVGHDVVEPVLDARPLEPDGVEHALCRRMQPGRRVAVPGEGGERLGHDRADRREVERRRPAPRRSRRFPTRSSPASATRPCRPAPGSSTVRRGRVARPPDADAGASLTSSRPDARDIPAATARVTDSPSRSAIPSAAASAASIVVTQLTRCRLAALRICSPSLRPIRPRGVLTTKLILPSAIRSTAVTPTPSCTLATT